MPDSIVTRELRFDLATGELGTKRRTPQGGLIVDGSISRVGVFEYRNPDGSIRRELRHPDEVFKAAALESFAHAPLTVDHPPGLVTADSWRAVTVGHVAGPVQKDGTFVSAELHIQDADTIRKVDKGELVELSCGYQCRLDMTPGVHPEFGEYDARQYDYVGNHVALGPKGWGRGGSEVKLHLDGGVSVSGVEPSYVRVMAAAKTGGGTSGTTETTTTETPGATGGAGGAGGGTTNHHADAALAGENAQLKAENERLRREKAERETTDSRAKEQERLDAAIEARTELVTSVQPHMGGKWTHKGKSDDQIRRDALAVLEPELELPEAKADGADAYVRGAFRSAIARADRVTGAWTEARSVIATAGTNAGGARTDKKKDEDEDDESVDDARNAYVAATKDAWKGRPPPGKRDKGGRDARGAR